MTKEVLTDAQRIKFLVEDVGLLKRCIAELNEDNREMRIVLSKILEVMRAPPVSTNIQMYGPGAIPNA